MEYPNKFSNLIECFKKFSGIGTKSAERMAYELLALDDEDLNFFIDSLNEVKTIKHCKICHNLCDDDLCQICEDENRNHSIICVVHYPKDVFAFEKIKEYDGIYHVLNGYISPSKNIGEDDININSLLQRVKEGKVKEVILATNLTVDGEMTALYIAKLLKDYPTKVTRLAHGLPMGAQLDYADELTLYRAFTNREKMEDE